MRWSLAVLTVILMLVVAACGGQPAGSSGGNGDGDGDGGSSTAPAASVDDGNGDGDGDGDGNGDGDGDVGALLDELTPDDADEINRTEAAGTVTVTWTSPRSPEEWVSHYDSVIEDAGMVVITRSSSEGTTGWLFAEDDSSSFGGSVTVTPGADGSGSQITIFVAPEQ